MTSKSAIKQAKEAIIQGQYDVALAHAERALEEQPGSFEANIYAGKAAFLEGGYSKAEIYYIAASDARPDAPQPLQGLVELYTHTSEDKKLISTLRILVKASKDEARVTQVLKQLATTLVKVGEFNEATTIVDQLISKSDMPNDLVEVPLELLKLKAECQIATDEAALELLIQKAKASATINPNDDRKEQLDRIEQQVAATWADDLLHLPAEYDALRQIILRTRAIPEFVHLHEEFLKRTLYSVHACPSGSVDRHDRRVHTVRLCSEMMNPKLSHANVDAMGCCSSYPYELALRLLELEEEVTGQALRTSMSTVTMHEERLHNDTMSRRGGTSSIGGDSAPFGSMRRGGLSVSNQSINGGLPNAGSISNLDRLSVGLPLVRSHDQMGNLSQSNSMTNLDRIAAGLPLLRGNHGNPSTDPLALESPRIMQSSLPPLDPHQPASPLPGRPVPHSAFGETDRMPGGWFGAPGQGSSAIRMPSRSRLSIGSETANHDFSIHGSYELQKLASLRDPPGGYSGRQSYTLAEDSESFSQVPDARPSFGFGLVGNLSRQSSAADDESLLGAPSVGSMNSSARSMLPPLSSLRGALSRDGGVVNASDRPTSDLFGSPTAHSVALMRNVSGSSFRGHLTGGPGNLSSALRAGEEVHAPAPPLGLIEDIERVATKLTHSFPWNPAGQAHIAMALGRRDGDLEGKLKKRQRARIIKQLESALTKGKEVPSAAAWLCLAELNLKDSQPQAAFNAAKAGLRYVNRRKRLCKEPLVQAGLALRLETGRALLALGELEKATEAFTFLKDFSSEGEVTFAYGAGCLPVSVRQQAFRGLAKVKAAQGDPVGAQLEYEKLLGKALRGYGPSEHWAHAEYAWLLFEKGDLASAQKHLNMAIDVSRMTQGVPSSIRASHHFKMGRVLYALGGKYRDDPEHAYAQFLEAASVDGPDQADAFAWLGHWFKDVKLEGIKARRCYRRALDLDPLSSEAGLALCDLLRESNSEELVADLCGEILQVEEEAAWALQRYGMHFLWINQPQKAIVHLQAALRGEPDNVIAWESLGAAYERIGRLTSSLKTYLRAVELDPRRLYSLTQAAAICSVMGDTDQALSLLDRADKVQPNHPAVLLGVCQTHTQLAELHVAIGAYTLAARNFAAGEAAAQRATRSHGTLEAAWKSLGDCLIRQTMLPTAAQPLLAAIVATHGTSDSATATLTQLESAFEQRFDKARAARRAYAAAVHLNPERPASWSDLALTQHHEVVLQGAHPMRRDASLADAKSVLAERLITGALRLAPNVPGLWSALGSINVAPAKREYALRRSLQLDSTGALAWLKLGRLYHSHGQTEAVEECYDNARSQDPKLAAIWEAMAAFNALPTAGLDPRALPESTELYRHALGLGGGAEADLGYAYGALRSSQCPQAPAYAAAHRAQPMQPMNPVVYHTLALVLEHSGSSIPAVRLLRIAATLLSRLPEQCESLAPCTPILLPSPGLTLMQSVQLDLARNLCKAGAPDEAIALYTSLDSAGTLVGNALALSAYATALLASPHPERAHAVMQRVITLCTEQGAPSHAALMLVRGTASAAGPAAAATAVESLAAATPPADVTQLWLTVLASAAAASDAPTLARARSALRTLIYGTNTPNAQEAAADVHIATCTLTKTPAASFRRSLYAVHTCPWSPPHRAIAANLGLTSCATSAGRLVSTAQSTPPTTDPGCGLSSPSPGHLDAAAVLTEHTAALNDPAGSALDASLRRAIKNAYSRIHLQPQAFEPWYQLSLLLTQHSIISGNCRSAGQACSHTLRLLQRSDTPNSTTIKVHLLLAQSIAELAQSCCASAMTAAQAALTAAAQSPLAGMCYRQVALCHHAVNNVAAAEPAFRQGIDLGDAPSALLLSQVLVEANRQDEAVALLERTVDVLISGDAEEHVKRVGLINQSGSEWIGVLQLRRVALLCTLDDIDRAKEVFIDSVESLVGAGRSIAGMFVASALLNGCVDVANDTTKRLGLAETRGNLRAARENSCRRDVLLGGTLLAGEGEEARGRIEAANEAFKSAAKQAAVAGVLIEGSSAAGVGSVGAPKLVMRSWEPEPVNRGTK